MPEIYQQPARSSVHLISEVSGLSRDQITLTGGSFVSGEVVGVLDDGRFTKLDLTDLAAEAHEAHEAHEAKAIIFGNVDATATDAGGLAHSRLTAVRADKLVWPTAATGEQKATFLAQLAVAHVIAR